MRTSVGQAASIALALAFEDPEVGAVWPKEKWKVEVTSFEQPGADRRMRVTRPDGAEVILTRYARLEQRPPTFPQSVCFIEKELAWAGHSDVGPVCVWISPEEPEEVASRVAAHCLETGWEFGSHSKLTFFDINSIWFRKGEFLRTVSVTSGNVVLDQVIKRKPSSVGS